MVCPRQEMSRSAWAELADMESNLHAIADSIFFSWVVPALKWITARSRYSHDLVTFQFIFTRWQPVVLQWMLRLRPASLQMDPDGDASEVKSTSLVACLRSYGIWECWCKKKQSWILSKKPISTLLYSLISVNYIFTLAIIALFLLFNHVFI